MQTADFFETGMQYMVKPGDRVTVYMEGPGFFFDWRTLKRRIGAHSGGDEGSWTDSRYGSGSAGRRGADCLIGVPSQMYALVAHAPGLARKQCF